MYDLRVIVAVVVIHLLNIRTYALLKFIVNYIA